MSRTTLENLYALTVPEVQKIFLEVMQGMVDRAILNEMVAAIEAGDEEALFKASGFTPAALNTILDRIEQTYGEAATITIDGFPVRARFIFNMRNAWVENDLKTRSSELVVRISEEVKENLRRTLEQGMLKGDNPRTTALNMVGRVNPVTKKREGGVIGMDVRQRVWAENAENYLNTLDERYFTLTLRDKRFDKTVQKAIESGKSLDKETIEKLITSYKNRALLYRSQVISRTETIRSINKGRYAAHKQGIDEGILKEKAITKEWIDANDGRVRNTHNIIGELYGRGKGVGFNEPFISPSGARLLFPGDDSLGAPPEEVIQCRCGINYKVDWVVNNE